MLNICAPNAIACHFDHLPGYIQHYIQANPAATIALAGMLACIAAYLHSSRR